ncbi:MAG: C40 family peptidase [Prevotella sp.]
MNYKKFFVAVLLSLIVVCPVFSENDKETKGNEQPDEIENFDFLYNNEDIQNYDYVGVDNMLDEAFSHLGARYRSGHSGPNAFDCSGFTSYVFKSLGIDLNRSSRAQYSQGTPVSKQNLQCGDLVFFTSRGSGKSIGHVGIVVDVDAMNGSFNFIHASIKGVKVSNSSEPYYSNRYVGARRVM